ncbi:MAG: leucine-rich repeat domain-containing protein [Chlamydiia bacterium]|nr:leucine-rich repeat domain-containing protein [Chlamydiia bacterium]
MSSREIRFLCNLEDPAYLITLPKLTSLTAPMRLSKLTYFPGVFNCPLLTRISLHKCEIKELGQIYLAFPQLEELALPHNKITHIHSKSLPRTLKMLDLSWNPIRRPVIERLNNLESLWLDGCQLESVRRVRHLRALKLFSMVFLVSPDKSSFKLGSGIDWDEVEVEFGTLRHFPCMKCCHSSLC